MKEAQFNSEIVKSINAIGWFAYKIADTPVSMARTLRFSPDKPCDIIASINGKFVAIESKQFKKLQAFSIRFIRESQIQALDRVIASGGESYIFLNIRIAANKAEGIKRQNVLLVFKWSKVRDYLKGGGKYSIQYMRDVMKDEKYLAAQVGNHWDLTQVFGTFMVTK